jgi:transcriptional regulator with XRE-family HTH domain
MRKYVHSKEQRTFREIIQAARKRAGLTQKQLADRFGKPQSFVAKYENGERRLDVIEFVTISRAIGANPVRLLALMVRSGI